MSDVGTHWIEADECYEATSPTYRLTEIVGTAQGSVDDAIANGLDKAAQTLHGLDWFEVQQIRGTVRDGDVGEFQVTLKVGFRVMTSAELEG